MNHDILNEIDLNPVYNESDDEQDHEQHNHKINTLNTNRDILKAKHFLNNYNQLAQLKKQPSANDFQHQLIIKNQILNKSISLKSVNLITFQFRNILTSFPFFNHVQSTVFDDAVYSDKNLVISAPTSPGKTFLLELAIIRLLVTLNYTRVNSLKVKFKIIYMAPLKALCTEKYNEWYEKFDKLHGLKCIELTGDSDPQSENEIENSHIICTTPEKWDSMTRKWKNRRLIMSRVKLILIDEIHVLDNSPTIRFIAISATIPNIDDIATWLSADYSTPATVYKLDNTFRPFCSTRKVSVQAALILAKSKSYFSTQQYKLVLHQASQNVKDPVLRDIIGAYGIAYHHAGLDSTDRNLVENLFLNGYLLVLCYNI